MSGDVLSVIEAAYAACSDQDAWLTNVLGAIHPHLDQGQGVFAHRFAHEPHRFWMSPIRGLGAAEQAIRLMNQVGDWQLEPQPANVALTSAQQKVYPRAPVVAWLCELLGRPWQQEIPPDFRLESNDPSQLPADSLGVIAGDPSGRGCVFFANAPKARPLPRQTKALWQHIAAHLVTGYRLAGSTPREPDAVLDGAGKVLHREQDVTRAESESMTDAARAIDRARSRLRRAEPESALTLWKGLVAGRWSLVDQFDHDGRRYVVARRNAVDVRPWQSLTEREAQVTAYAAQGQSHKMIAYQLGLSVATISLDLSLAARKVGVRSRLELIAAYRASHEEDVA